MPATLPQTTGADLMNLRDQCLAWNARAKARGEQFTKWICPHCLIAQEAMQPRPIMVDDRGFWDSLKTCLDCGHRSFVKVWPDGRTEVLNQQTA